MTKQELSNTRTLLNRRVASQKEADRIFAMIEKLNGLLKEEIVHFTYDKKCGEERHAYGTLDPEIIGRHCEGPKRTSPEKTFTGTFPYFDIVRKAWRAFRVENLISVDTENYTI